MNSCWDFRKEDNEGSYLLLTGNGTTRKGNGPFSTCLTCNILLFIIFQLHAFFFGILEKKCLTRGSNFDAII